MDSDIKEIVAIIKSNIPRTLVQNKCVTQNTRVMKKWIGILTKIQTERDRATIHYQKNRQYHITDHELEYIPKSIYDALRTHPHSRYSFLFSTGTRQINVHFHCQKSSERHIKKCFEKVYLWFQFITFFAKAGCSNEITLNLYFTPYKKKFAEKHAPLDQINMNTAFTTSCRPSTSIYIYREEEWFKVLMHESFHNLGLDFSSMDERYSNAKMQSLFPITSRNGIRIYESYCETWATFLNCLMTTFLSTQNKSDTSLILEKTGRMLDMECKFALLQCTRVLNHYGLTYRELLSSSKRTRSIGTKFVEHSHALSYYIIKCNLLCHFDDFFTWCRLHNKNVLNFNKTYENVDEYIAFIEYLSKHPSFLEKTDYIQQHASNILNADTLRMTLYG
tara:strand:+ start:18768 stop:19940 length:1173 start_codon:yes stop_codon:yes gene_type:complete